MLIRTLIAAVALLMPFASARAAAPATNDPSGVIVQGQPRNAYVIRLNTTGKDPATIRQEIWSAAWTACQRAPRTANVLDIRPTALHACASEAAWRGMLQLDDIIEKRRQGNTVSIYGYQEYDE